MKTFSLIFILFLSNFIFSQSAKSADYHNDKAIDELMLGNNQTALNEINQALKINPKNANYYYMRGCIYQEMKDLNNALINYNTALKLNPKQTDALLKVATVYLILKNNVKACEALRLACSYGESKGCEIKNKICN